MTVQFHDMARTRVAQVGLATTGGVQWADREPFTDVARVRGGDLTEVRRRAAAVRAERPDVTVVAEIEVVIAASEREARTKLPPCGPESPDAPLLYVGTPRGLAGLVSDLHAVGIADGAVLIPLADGVADLVRHHVLPVFGPDRSEDPPALWNGNHRSDTVTSDGRAALTDDDYRATLRRHPAGVAIITLMGETGPVGFTATSFASLSLSPPLVCFNITHTSSSIAALRAAPSVVVHLPSEQQLDVARRFSASAEQRFADPATWMTLDTGEPVLVGTPTWLRAAISDLIPAGDSTLVIAEVTRVHCDQTAGTPAPLLYHDGQYRCAREVGADIRTP